MTYEYYKDYLADYNNLAGQELIPLWNQMQDEIGGRGHIYLLKGKNIDEIFENEQLYQQAVNDGTWTDFPEHIFYCHDLNGKPYSMEGLDQELPFDNHYSDGVLIEWLEKKAHEEFIYDYICSDLHGEKLCTVWNSYCTAMQSTSFVFANPDKNSSCNKKWVSIVDNQINYAPYSDELMDLGALAKWISSTKPKICQLGLNFADNQIANLKHLIIALNP